jgi:hypothetical protein
MSRYFILFAYITLTREHDLVDKCSDNAVEINKNKINVNKPFKMHQIGK